MAWLPIGSSVIKNNEWLPIGSVPAQYLEFQGKFIITGGFTWEMYRWRGVWLRRNFPLENVVGYYRKIYPRSSDSFIFKIDTSMELKNENCIIEVRHAGFNPEELQLILSYSDSL